MMGFGRGQHCDSQPTAPPRNPDLNEQVIDLGLGHGGPSQRRRFISSSRNVIFGLHDLDQPHRA
jgi:hypothetical protein